MTAEPVVFPRWLDAKELEAWRAFLEAMQRVNAAVSEQLQRDSNLSHGDYEILVRLSEEPDRSLRMSELAERNLFSRSRVSHAVGRLEREGWVVRRPSIADGRGLVATLTDSGFAKLEAAAPGHIEAVRTVLLDRLTPAQVDQLAEISRAIVAPPGK